MTTTQTEATTLFFEDFRIGQSYTSGSRTLTDADLALFTEVSGDHHPLHRDADYASTTRFGRPIFQGPFGLAAIFGLVNDMHIVDDSIIGLLDTQWTYTAPIYVGDTITFEMTIVGTRRTSQRMHGVVDRHIVLRNERGDTVQEGTSAILVSARSETSADDHSRSVGTSNWGTSLATLANNDPEFASATNSFDGTIAVRSGPDEVGFHIYRGRIIDVASWTPLGPTFTISGSRLSWTKLITGARNELIEAAMRNDITVHGNTYEYRRLIKAVMILVDHARDLAAQGAPE